MRSIRTLAALAVLVVAAALAAVGSAPAAPPAYTLQILHFYGETGTIADQTAPIMGAMADRFKSQVPNTLTVSEGDIWIPGPWLTAGADPLVSAVPGIGATALGRPDVAILNALGTNVSALGNHEFDLGSPVVSGAIAASGAWVGAQFPLITANLDFSKDSSLNATIADRSLGGCPFTGAGNTCTAGPTANANLYAGKEASTIKAKIAPSAVVTIGGEKIGVVGLTNWELLSKTSPNGTVPKDDGNPATSDLQEVAAYVQAAVDGLEAAGVNKIVMVDQLDDITRNEALAPLVRGIDVMVAGGGHERQGDANDVPAAFNGHDADFARVYPISLAGSDGKPVLIVTTDTEYTYLGRLVVGFDAAGAIDPTSLDTVVNGAYASDEATLKRVYNTTDPASTIVAASATGSKIKAITSVINNIVTTKDGNKYGFSKVYLEGDRVFARAQETNLGDITADANMLRAAKGLPAGTALWSLKNGGGIRSSIGSVDEDGAKVANPLTATGNVSQLDVENALRFDNKLMTFDTTPQGLKNILEFTATLATQPGQQNGGYPQVGGIRYSFDTTRAVGDRVRNVALYDLDGNQVATVVRNGAVAPGAPATITAVVLNFTANGGDSYPIKANASNFRYLRTTGGLSAPVADPTLDLTAAATFATVNLTPAEVLGEQKAFEEYMKERHASLATAYDQADTPQSQDLRIQNLAFRSDAVLSAPKVATPAFAAGTTDCRASSTLSGISFADGGSNAGPWTVSVGWGDGSPATTWTATTAGAQPDQSHTYLQPGTYTATVTVTDADGGVGTASASITVQRAYTVSFQAPVSGSTAASATPNVIRGNRTLPVKATIWDACAQAYVTDPATQVTLVLKAGTTAGTPATNDAKAPGADAGSSNGGTLLLAWKDGVWQFNLSTRTAIGGGPLVAGTTYRLDLYVGSEQATRSQFALLEAR